MSPWRTSDTYYIQILVSVKSENTLETWVLILFQRRVGNGVKPTFSQGIHFNSAYMNKKMSPSLVTLLLLLLFSPPFLLITAGSQRIHETQRLVQRRETKNYDVLLLNTFDSKGLRLTPTWWNKSKTKPFNWAPLAFSSSRTGSSTLSFPQWESTQLTFQGELRGKFCKVVLTLLLSQRNAGKGLLLVDYSRCSNTR